nr:protein kinase-like domain, phloem protein 2-like protein [Tanacetum cinerariifolium]
MSEEFAHLRVPLENILSATNNFSEENCIGTSGFAKEYKGQLLWSGELIELYARRLSKEWDGVEQLFWTGISMLSSLKHKNVVSLVGFCDENDEKILIIMLETRASLTNYLSDPMLTWVRRLEICVAIAHALSYIHYDEARDFSVIHGSLCSANVLLNDDWEPKLSEFEFSMKIKASQRHHSFHTSKLEYVNGYGDPTYIETKRLSHKSDIYSFGIVMLELLCGRKSISEHPDNKYLAGTAIFHYKMEILDEIIDPDLWKQMDPQSFKVFAQTAYDCLNEERPQRPNIHEIVTRLETALKLQMERQDAVHSIVVAEVEDTSSNHDEGSLTSVSTHVESHLSKKTKSFLKDLSHLKLSWKDITSATNNFAQENIVRKFRFGTIYKGHLLQSDQSIDITAKRFNLDYLKDERKRFWTEVSMLSSLKHKNLVSIIGFYDDEEDKIIIYKEANRSLEAYLSDQTLTWMQRLKICVGVAKALSYIHYDPGRDFSVIHCNIMSSNILLDDKWEPKLSGFELLLKNTVARRHRLLLTTDIVKNVYLDPEYKKTGGVTHKSDVYSFGVVLFSVLYGRSVDEDELGERLSSQLEKSHLEDMVDPQLRKQMDPESFGIFSETAYYCLQEKRVKRPYIDQVVKRLDKAFELQWKHENLWKNLEHLKIGLNDIELATENFANTYCIGEGRYGLVYKAQLEHFDSSKSSLIDWGNKCDLPKKRSIVAIKRIFNTQGEQGLIKLATQSFIQENIIGHGDSGNVYRGHTDGHNIIATKRLDRKSTEGEAEFMTELKILIEYKHEKVIGLLGYSDEEDEKVIVYEYASRGSLDKYLNNDCLTWVMRLKICIDVAIGLEFLHGTVSSSEMVIHRDVNSSSILLLDDWKAKITDFGLSLVCPTNQDVDYVIDNPRGTIGYRDPLYVTTGFLTKESDIFSLGAVLFDVLCGKLSSVKLDDEYLYLPFLAKQHYYLGKLDELVFEGIKEQIEPQSFITFARVAYQCIHHRRERRPSAQEVVMQLKKALEFQEDYEKWEPKLPKDYKEIIQMSKCPEIYSTKKKEELYNIFSKGILLQQDKVLLSFEGNGERNEMVSATMFSFINSCPHEWKSLPSSRFGTVVEMLDISNLSFEIKIDAQFLSPDVVYGAFLVFRLCDSRIFSSKPMCVNLKYRKGLESRQSYFATWRDKDWMMIELYQFLNQNEDVVFEFLIESFSSYYCGESAVYVEGIEFRAIDRIKHEEIGKMKEAEQVLKTKFNADQAALYKYSNVDLFTLQPSALSRFQVVIELLPQQVFHINCTIKSQMLSPDTEYVCYLMFKLSEQCQGLHCPVKVRDLLHQENNEADFFYFITPSPLNINDITRVSKQREDGWMEIQLWKFNSTHEFKDGSLSMNMKFTSHEGIMSGLIVCGLEFRPM